MSKYPKLFITKMILMFLFWKAVHYFMYKSKMILPQSFKLMAEIKSKMPLMIYMKKVTESS